MSTDPKTPENDEENPSTAESENKEELEDSSKEELEESSKEELEESSSNKPEEKKKKKKKKKSKKEEFKYSPKSDKDPSENEKTVERINESFAEDKVELLSIENYSELEKEDIKVLGHFLQENEDEAELNSRFNEIVMGLSELSIESEEEEEENDEVLEDSVDMAIVKQAEGTVIWRIEGLFTETGEIHQRSYLKKNPPAFIIEDDKGDIVEFLVTQNLAFSLREAFDRIYQGYYGVKKRKKNIDPSTGTVERVSFKSYVKDNPLKVGMVVMAVLVALVILLVI